MFARTPGHLILFRAMLFVLGIMQTRKYNVRGKRKVLNVTENDAYGYHGAVRSGNIFRYPVQEY
jgi:hypothetical protein